MPQSGHTSRQHTYDVAVDGRKFRRLVVAAFRAHGVPRVSGEWVVEHKTLTWYVELVCARPGDEPTYDLVIGAWVPDVQPSDPGKANDCAFTFHPESEPWTGPRVLPPTEPMMTASDLRVPLAFSLEYDITDQERAQQVDAYIGRLVAHLRSVTDLASLARAHNEGMQPAVTFVEMSAALQSET